MDYELARERLLTKRQDLLHRLQTIYRDLHVRDARVRADFGEQSVEMESRELILTLDADGSEELGKVDRALKRVLPARFSTLSILL